MTKAERTERAEQAYDRAMAKWTLERGRPILAQYHAIHAADCLTGCGCASCVDIRKEREEERLRKAQARAGRGTRVAA